MSKFPYHVQENINTRNTKAPEDWVSRLSCEELTEAIERCKGWRQYDIRSNDWRVVSIIETVEWIPDADS